MQVIHRITSKKKLLIKQQSTLLNNTCFTWRIIYTSGASEANNLAIKGILERYKHRGKHVLISPLEHNSILSILTKMQENGFIVEMIPLKEDGQVNVEKWKSNDSSKITNLVSCL